MDNLLVHKAQLAHRGKNGRVAPDGLWKLGWHARHVQHVSLIMLGWVAVGGGVRAWEVLVDCVRPRMHREKSI